MIYEQNSKTILRVTNERHQQVKEFSLHSSARILDWH
jgi:hypothetical protein